MSLASIKNNYNHTIYASYIGYITQAIINNFAPLLFLTFQSSYSISLDQIAVLITFNFAVQLVVDLLAARYVDRIGYRRAIVIAHIACTAGLIGLAALPELLPSPYLGLLLSIGCYAVGGGLIEVLVSPIVEACPTQKKEAAMSILHSFYCWGACLCRPLLDRFLRLRWDRKLADPGADLGGCPPLQRLLLFAGPHRAAGGGGRTGAGPLPVPQ